MLDSASLGMITDGDVRRALQAHDDIRGLRAVGRHDHASGHHRSGGSSA